jgi:hypothetical protein
LPLQSVQELLNAQLDGSTAGTGTLRVSAIAGFSYSNITVSAQTTVKSAAGLIHGVSINTSPTSAGRLYDNTVSGGSVIASYPASVAAGTFYQFDAKFSTGLTVSTGSSDTNITVIYL